MAVKNFSFKENWVGSKVTGMKATFLSFFKQPGPTFLSQTVQTRISLKKILVKKNKNYIIINFVTSALTS